MDKRAVRRHHVYRLKETRKNYFCLHSCYSSTITPRKLGMIVDTPTRCSCWMCGNPRKWKLITLAEQKALDDFVDQMNEILTS